MKEKVTAGREQLGTFAPFFAELNDDVLFGRVWDRTEALSLHDRSMITVTTLIASGILDSSLIHHIERAKANGVTKEEMVELITQVAFYSGWPKAWAAFRFAKEIYADEEIEQHGGIFGLGEPNVAFQEYFIGQSYLKPLTILDNPKLGIFNVTFEPGCRNNWHIHKSSNGGGQILICIDGEGWYQEDGKEAQSLQPGDMITIPVNVKHWHGAKKHVWFSHLAVEVPGDDTENVWLEPVVDEVYNKLEDK